MEREDSRERERERERVAAIAVGLTFLCVRAVLDAACTHEDYIVRVDVFFPVRILEFSV